MAESEGMSNSPPAAALAPLVARFFGSRARITATRAVAGDASSRSYFRLALEGARVPTAILMVQSGSGLSVSSDELSTVTPPASELPFLNVQRYLDSVGIAVPKVYANDREKGLVLLEDVGDTTLWDAVRSAGREAAVFAEYEAAIGEMLRLQRAGAEHPSEDCIAFHQRFDGELFLWEFDHFLEYGLVDRPVDAATRAELRQRFEALAGELGSWAVALNHRDYHSWNLFRHEGRLRVIDFQDALFAPEEYDLATLLNDRATPTVVTPVLERRLLESYARKRAEICGGGVDLDRRRSRYYRLLLQKSLKILGRFPYLEDVKGKKGYRAMLPDTIATLRRALEGLPELVSLRALLGKAYPEVL